jgi:hypothetical protein
MDLGLRNILIALLAFGSILLPAGFLLQHSHLALGAIEVLAFVGGAALLVKLDDRQRRREHRG